MSTTPRPIDPDVLDDHKYFFDWDACEEIAPARVDPRAWPEERISELRRLWLAGVYAKDIADKLGVTRPAVIGKANRLGLPQRCSRTDFRPRNHGAKGNKGQFRKTG